MCGIAGVIGGNDAWSIDGYTSVITSMLESLRHRGPDASGLWADADAGIVLGHRRLSILDLQPTGAQPMISQCGRWALTFNGEIYNHAKLSAELRAAGVTLRGRSDTEVLLECAAHFGVERTLQRAEGMFAFGLWDRVDRTLWLARDRVGEKPLYYGWVGEELYFASELRAFSFVPDFTRRVSRESLVDFLQFGYVSEPFSMFEDVYKLPPGSALRISARDASAGAAAPHFSPYAVGQSVGGFAPKQFWSARDVANANKSEQLPASEEASANALDALLHEVVGEHLVADVPVGVFLSGGIDSSLISSIAQRISPKKLKSFTIGFPVKEYDESAHARSVADLLGTDHVQVNITDEQLLNLVAAIPRIYDEPVADASQIPTYVVSEIAKSHVTVVLSGDGGDELFGGYNRYQFGDKLWSGSQLIPGIARSGMSAAIGAVSPGTWDKIFSGLSSAFPRNELLGSNYAGTKLHKVASALDAQSPLEMYRRLISCWDGANEIVAGHSDAQRVRSQPELLGDNFTLVEQFMFWDLIGYLPGDILAKVDRASMAASLETRLPLLDRRVVEFAWKLPVSHKIEGNHGKKILRRVLYQYLDPALFQRPKMGFSVPMEHWLRGPLREYAESLLSESALATSGMLIVPPIREKWAQHLRGTRNHQAALWAILSFQAWYFEHCTHAK